MKATIALALVTPLLAAGALAVLPESGRSDPAGSPSSAQVAPGEETAPQRPDPGPAFEREALLPHFATGDLAAARARFEAGLYAEAWKLLGEVDDDSPQVALLRALSALELEQNEEAARILEPLPAKLPALADRIHWNLGRARERSGDLAGAAAAWAQIPADSARSDEATLARARALAALGRSAEALKVLSELRERPAPAWGNDHGATALLLAGELHLERGEKEQARAAWLRLWSGHALAPEAKEAKRQADRLGGAGPTLEQKVARAQGFLNAHRNQEGTGQIAALLKQLDLPDPLACEARYALGRGYRKMRHHSKAIPVLEAVAEACSDPAVRVKALYILGQSTTIVAPEKAVGVYETLAREFADHSFADDALYFLSELHERAGDMEAARTALERLVEAHPDGDYRADALFRLYWLDRKAGKDERGLEALRLLERDFADQADPEPVERSLYWQGRTYAGLGREVEALATWERLVREHPASYYAMLARGRLEQLVPGGAVLPAAAKQAAVGEEAQALKLHTGALLPDRHYHAALELIRLGFHDAAADELLRIDREAARERAAGSSEPVLLVAWLLDHVESRRAAHHIARTELNHLLRGRPEGEAAAHFRIAYPLAFRDLIERHSDKYGVPADLMQALMREESSLDPQIVSWAGAVGLTQLMPSTARAVARRLKLGTPTVAQLRDPDLNVRIGTAYLGQLLRRWKGNPALATASYNAGPGAVARWLAERGELEMDEFVEEIPIEQTRHYVKRVLDSYTTYRLTYGEGEERFVALLPTRADGKALQ